MQTLATTEVVANQQRTTLGMLYIGVLGLFGAGLVGAAYVWSWGFCGYGIAGFFLFMSGLGLFRTLAYGGAWTAECPGCRAKLSSDEHAFPIRSEKVIQCRSCKGWWGGTELLAPLDVDHVHKDPIFEATVRGPFAWPEGCARCGEPATRTVGITPTHDGDALASVVGVQIIGGDVVQVPVCDAHRQTPVSIHAGGSSLAIQFRSYRIYRQFQATNGEVELDAYLATVREIPHELHPYADPPWRCPVHDRPLMTQIGWASRMDATPETSFMNDAAENPYCLDVGQGIGDMPERCDPRRLVYCPGCVDGMAAKGWA